MKRFKNTRELSESFVETGGYIAVTLTDKKVTIPEDSLKRLFNVAESTGAPLVYSYYMLIDEAGNVEDYPLIEYQSGSLRDDFDFGGVVLLNKSAVRRALDRIGDVSGDIDGGWYALRLALSEEGSFRLLPEYLYTMDKTDFRSSGEKQHDYVNPRAKCYQLAMEKIVTEFLRRTSALVPEKKKSVDFDYEGFATVCSVIIPVRNRVKTVGDAVNSALGQECPFPFNVIVIDNGSTDGTRELLSEINDDRLIVIHVEDDELLGIGGCWNRGIDSPDCGIFAVQLDSDDVYSSPDTLRLVVEKFRETGAAMVIGAYTLTDFDMNILPPGQIDHNEWTDENGANNALRINGLGAPRAFYTPIVRELRFPNVSYGEDYGMALRISREWKVGRIFDSLYLCRRWGGNSDAALNVRKVNENNYYKDFLRTNELESRRKLNNGKL